MAKIVDDSEIVDDFGFEDVGNLLGFEEIDGNKFQVLNAQQIKRSLKRKKKKQQDKKKLENINEELSTVCEESGKFVKVPQEGQDDLFVQEMEAWQRFKLPEEILKALHDKRFFKPTPIQEKCLYAALTSQQSDLIGAAQTGSGKTYAFGIPVVQAIMKFKKAAIENGECDKGKLYAIVMTPTRELAVQVKDHLNQLCKYTDIRTALVVGGLAKEKQERILNKKPDIVIGTPGRLWELFSEGNEHLENLPSIRLLVVDEADRMLEKQHFAELGTILDRLNEDPVKRSQRRNFVFSATLTVVHDLPRTYKGKKLTKNSKLKELFNTIGVNAPLIYDLSVENYIPQKLSEWKVVCQLTEKDYYLVHFLQYNVGRTIVFCNSISCVRRLANLLSILLFKTYPIHANMEQKQRLRNLEKFSGSEDGILLATDVAARGLDIPLVGHVVHFQVPRTAESYVHRSGRTARGTNEGLTLLIVGYGENSAYKKLMKTLKRDTGIDDLDVPYKELDNVKELVHVARDIDQLDLALRRNNAREQWFEKAAKELDLVVDEDERPEKVSNYALKKLKKDLSIKQSQLKMLLNSDLTPKYFSRKFPDTTAAQKPKKKRQRKV